MKTIAETNQEVNDTAVFTHGDKPCAPEPERLAPPNAREKSRSSYSNYLFNPLMIIVDIELAAARRRS